MPLVPALKAYSSKQGIQEDRDMEHLSWGPGGFFCASQGVLPRRVHVAHPPPHPTPGPCSRCTSSSMDVSLPLGMASFTLRQVKTRPMSRSVGLMSSWLMVVSLFPSFSSSWGGRVRWGIRVGDTVKLKAPSSALGVIHTELGLLEGHLT